VIRQVVIDDDEIVTVHGVPVTTPARTVVDLARREDWTPQDETAAGDVSSQQGVTSADAVAVLDRRGRLPHRTRTVDRLGRICAADASVQMGDESPRDDEHSPRRAATIVTQPALTR
jgi:hypothetical protein